MDFEPALLAMPAGLGVVVGALLGFVAFRVLSERGPFVLSERAKRASRRAASIPLGAWGRLLFAGVLGVGAGATAGWLLGAFLFKTQPLCTAAGVIQSTRPHSLFLAPVVGTLFGFFAMLVSGKKTRATPGAIGLLWMLTVAVPTALALFFGKATTSVNPLFRDCLSLGPRLVANAALVGTMCAAFAALAVNRWFALKNSGRDPTPR